MPRFTRGIAALFCISAALAPAVVRADTIVTQRINATHRLLPLQKITVGPDDQYAGSADPTGKTLVFTHKSDLVPHLCRQNLATGDATDLLPLTADSQESSFGPDGRIVFTYYKFNARGDVCYAAVPKDAANPVADNQITCLKAGEAEAQSERSNPFWRSAHEIGFVVRDISTQVSRIVSEDLNTGVRQTLAQGKVWSPAMKAGGRYLFYSELGTTKDIANRVLMLKDLMTGTTRPIHFELPGISGFPAVSEDEKYVYFSHYLDDTNGDNVIDGSDNSVVFRAPIDSLLKTAPEGEYFPEQLTSVENNCSFPRPFGGVVYVSCAFEGALDVYQMPNTGVVPMDWTPAILTNAHQTARTYAERILLLNTMKFRYAASGQLLDERLLGDHLLADDTTAAKYYISRLQPGAKPAIKDFYAILRLYLLAREKKKAQPSAEISREFQNQIQNLDEQVQALHGQVRFQHIVRGLLRAFLEQPTQALSFLKTVKFDTSALPLERYFYFELASWTIPRTRADTVVVESLTAAYKQMAGAPELGEEAQIYYAFNLLKYLQQAEDPKDPKSVVKRISVITGLNHGLPKPVDQLLQSEVAALTIIEAQDDASKVKAYAPLDKLMSASRDDYYLRKALYIRAILCFTDAEEFKFIDFVASNWLRYTAMGDTEFIHAREFYADEELDHGYGAWGEKKYQLAASFFYGSLSFTDDLESHAGYIRATVLSGQRATLADRYKNLVNRHFIDDNMKFVEALLLLIDTAPDAARDPATVKYLDEALVKLQAMVQDRDSPVRYLLMGYCKLEKLLRTSVGLEFDSDLFKSAHRDLMLAYDLGRDNDRIKASVLMDLGILHQRAQNAGLASRFFALRKPLGFVSSEEAAAFAWLYAQALYSTHEPDKAADELAHAPGDVPQNYIGPLLEREAFYRTSASQYDQAAELYGKLLQSGHIQGEISLAKVNLNYGFALFKLKRLAPAQAALRVSLEHAVKLTPIAKDRTRLIDFNPVRIKLAAYGLLSRMGSDSDRIDALEKRAALLPEAKPLFDTSYLPTVIENRLDLGAVTTRAEPARSAHWMEEALESAESLGDSDLGYLSNAVFRAATQYMAHGWLHPELYAGVKADRIRKVVGKCIEAYDKQRGAQPLLSYQKLKLEALWAAYQSKVLKNGQPAGPELQTLAASEAAAGLKSAMPAQWKEFEALSVALAR